MGEVDNENSTRRRPSKRFNKKKRGYRSYRDPMYKDYSMWGSGNEKITR